MTAIESLLRKHGADGAVAPTAPAATSVRTVLGRMLLRGLAAAGFACGLAVFDGFAFAQSSDLLVPEPPRAGQSPGAAFQGLPPGFGGQPGAPGPGGINVLPEDGKLSLEGEAVKAIKAQDWPTAIKMLQQLLEKEPTNEEAILALASVYIRQKQPSAAVAHLTDYVNRQPGNKKLRLALGQALLEAKRICAAVSAFSTLYNMDPNYPDVRHYLGLAYLQAGMPLTAYRILGGPTSSEDMASAQRLVTGAALAALGQGCPASQNYRYVMSTSQNKEIVEQAQDLQEKLDQSICCPTRWSGFLRIGQRYDDNPGVLPTTNQFGDAIFASAPSSGNSYTAALAYDLYRGYQGNVTAGGQFFATDNYSASPFNLGDGQLFIAGTKREMWNCTPITKGARFDYDYLTVGADSYLQRFAGTAFLTAADTDYSAWTFLGRYSNLDFLGLGAADGTIFDTDSQDYAVGVYRQRQVACRKVTLVGGYQFDYNDSQGDYDFNNNLFIGSATWQSPIWDLIFTGQYQFYMRDYLDLDPLTGLSRYDLEHVFQVAISKQLSKNWYATFTWLRDRNDSTVPTSNYVRNLYEFTLQYNFGGAQATNLAERRRLTY